MNKILQYLLKFSADTGSARQQIDALGKSSTQLKDNLKQTGRSDLGAAGAKDLAANLDKAAGSATSLKSMMTSLAGAAGLTGLVASVVSITQAMYDAQRASDKLANQLKYVSGSSAGARDQLSYLREATQRIGLDFASSADAYAKFSAAAKGAGISTQTTRQVFEGVAKAAATMGLSAEETSGALLALSQMASKGTVSAEELRGQLGERLPGAFSLAARAMGVTEAELGKLMETGQLMASDFLPKFGAALNKEFAAPIQSLTAELNRFNSAWDLWKRELAAADGGLFKPLTNGLNESAAAMRTLGSEAGLVQKLLVAIGGFEMGAIGQGKFDTQQVQATAMRDLARVRDERKALEDYKAQHKDEPESLYAFQRRSDLEKEERQLRDRLLGLAVRRGKETGLQLPNLKEQFTAEKKALDDELKKFLDGYKDKTDKAGEEIERYKALMLKRGEAADPAVIAQIQKKYAKTNGGGDLASALLAETRAAADAEMKLLQQKLSEAGDALQRAYDQRLIGARAYYTAQASLEDQALAAQEQSLRKQLAQATSARNDADGRAEIAKRTAEITRLEGELAVITEKRGQVAEKANAKTEQSLTTLREKLDEVRQKLAESNGDRSPEQIEQGVRARYKEILEQARVNAADIPDGVSLVEKMIDVETAKERLADIQSAWQRTTAALNAEEQRINILKENGLLGEIDSRTQIVQLHQDAATALQAQLPLLDEMAQRFPNLATEIARMKNEWLSLSSVTDQWTTTFNGAAKSAMAQFFTDATNRSKSFGEAAMDALNAIRNKMVSLAAEHLADAIFQTSGSSSGGGLIGGVINLVGGFFSGSSSSGLNTGVGSGFNSANWGVKHIGGLIGSSDGIFRSGLSFSSARIAAAPRFHSGGVIGADERLLVGKVGEEVLTADDPRHIRNGGAANSAPEIHIHEAAGSRVSQVQSSNQGSRIDVFLEQVDGFLARNLIKGSGSLTDALETVGAVSRGRSMRGG